MSICFARAGILATIQRDWQYTHMVLSAGATKTTYWPQEDAVAQPYLAGSNDKTRLLEVQQQRSCRTLWSGRFPKLELSFLDPCFS